LPPRRVGDDLGEDGIDEEMAHDLIAAGRCLPDPSLIVGDLPARLVGHLVSGPFNGPRRKALHRCDLGETLHRLERLVAVAQHLVRCRDGVSKQLARQVHGRPQAVVVLVDQRSRRKISGLGHHQRTVESVPDVPPSGQPVEVFCLHGERHFPEVDYAEAAFRQDQNGIILARPDIDNGVVHEPPLRSVVVDLPICVQGERSSRRSEPDFLADLLDAPDVRTGQFGLGVRQRFERFGVQPEVSVGRADKKRMILVDQGHAGQVGVMERRRIRSTGVETPQRVATQKQKASLRSIECDLSDFLRHDHRRHSLLFAEAGEAFAAGQQKLEILSHRQQTGIRRIVVHQKPTCPCIAQDLPVGQVHELALVRFDVPDAHIGKRAMAPVGAQGAVVRPQQALVRQHDNATVAIRPHFQKRRVAQRSIEGHLLAEVLGERPVLIGSGRLSCQSVRGRHQHDAEARKVDAHPGPPLQARSPAGVPPLAAAGRKLAYPWFTAYYDRRLTCCVKGGIRHWSGTPVRSCGLFRR